MMLISILCTLSTLFRRRRSPGLLVAGLLILPASLTAFLVGAGGPWTVLLIPILIAVPFVLVGVALTRRVSS